MWSADQSAKSRSSSLLFLEEGFLNDRGNTVIDAGKSCLGTLLISWKAKETDRRLIKVMLGNVVSFHSYFV